jgi:hypothetical protein
MGGTGRRHAHAHVRRLWRHQPFCPRSKTNERGPHVGERGRAGGLARPTKGQGPVVGGVGSPMGRKR